MQTDEQIGIGVRAELLAMRVDQHFAERRQSPSVASLMTSWFGFARPS